MNISTTATAYPRRTLASTEKVFAQAKERRLGVSSPQYSVTVVSKFRTKLHRAQCPEADGAAKQVSLIWLISKIKNWCECLIEAEVQRFGQGEMILVNDFISIFEAMAESDTWHRQEVNDGSFEDLFAQLVKVATLYQGQLRQEANEGLIRALEESTGPSLRGIHIVKRLQLISQEILARYPQEVLAHFLQKEPASAASSETKLVLMPTQVVTLYTEPTMSEIMLHGLGQSWRLGYMERNSYSRAEHHLIEALLKSRAYGKLKGVEWSLVSTELCETFECAGITNPKAIYLDAEIKREDLEEIFLYAQKHSEQRELIIGVSSVQDLLREGIRTFQSLK